MLGLILGDHLDFGRMHLRSSVKLLDRNEYEGINAIQGTRIGTGMGGSLDGMNDGSRASS